MSKSWSAKDGCRWIARRWRTFPFNRRPAPKDCSTRFSPDFFPSRSCPDVSSALISEASMPSTSEGRVSSTKRKRTSEMDVDSETPEPRTDSSPKKRKLKTNRSSLEDEDWVSATKKNSTQVPEEMENCPKESSDDSIYKTCQLRLPSVNVSVEQQCSHTKVDFETDLRNFEPRPVAVEEFLAKYQIFKVREQGTFGKVYTGERLEDQLPVAVKVMRKEHVLFFTEVVNDVPSIKTPMEVMMLSRVGAGLDSAGSTITPLLLDWYDVGVDVLLVFERPEPCMDLLDYMHFYHRQGVNSEIAKVIFRPLVEAAIEMQARGIFHRDIKPENILIEDNDVIPSARFIDFGSATTFLPGDIFTGPQGTVAYCSPEWFRDGLYEAGPTTVWQMGRVLYVMLFNRIPLKREESIGSFRQVPIPADCSEDLRDLLRGCLAKDPARRVTLEEMINHPWLNS